MRFPLLIAAALVGVTLLLAPARAEDAPPADMNAATVAFAEGRLDECVKICSEVSTSLPADNDEHVRALYLRGQAYLLQGKPAEAETDLRGVVAERKKSAVAHEALGRALAAQRKNDDAETSLRTAVDLDKKSATAHRALGEVLIAKQSYSDARTVLAKAWKLGPGDPLTAIPLVDVELGYKSVKGALKIARAVIKKHPEHPVGHFLLGRALEYDGEWKDAAAAYEASIACDDTYADAHKNLAIVLHTQNDMYRDREMLDRSMKAYERYFELGGNEPELRRVYDQMVAFLAWQKEEAGK